MIEVRRLGTTAYQETLERMRTFTRERMSKPSAVPDELWLTEHPPVFTLGFASRPEHLLNPGDIPVVETERGGQVTYHGPGQLIAYLLLDLRRRGLGVRELVCRIERGVIACLAEVSVAALRKPGAPGIYVAPRTSPQGRAELAKIASIGLKVSRGFTWHGVALNACMNLEPFTRINPCGYPDLRMTDVFNEAGTDFTVELEDLADRLAAALVCSIER